MIMKKLLTLCLSLLLLLSMTGCSTLVSIVSSQAQATHTPEPTAVPDEEPTTDPAAEAADSTPEPDAEPTPEPTPEPPVEAINAALEAYHTLFETGFSSAGSNAWQLNACPVLSGDPADFSAFGYNELHWVQDFVLCDLSGDLVPELILCSGEVERYIYIFEAVDGTVEFRTRCISGNQEEVNYAFWVYQTAEGETQHYSVGVTGSGAGDLSFAYQILTDLSVEETFSCFDDPTMTYCHALGAEVDPAEYDEAYSAYFDGMTLVEKLEFTALGSDPVAAFEEAAGH